jgi:hypothetical protein
MWSPAKLAKLLSGKRHANLFFQFAGERHQQRLAPFDPATGKPPSRTIAMPHQQHPALGIDHRALRAERQPAPHAPDRPEHGCQQPVRPEPSEQTTLGFCLFLRHRSVGFFRVLTILMQPL